jgi:hypothetical protein
VAALDRPERDPAEVPPDSTSLGILERASNAILDLDTLGPVTGTFRDDTPDR